MMAGKLLVLAIILAGVAYIVYDPYIPKGYSTSSYLQLAIIRKTGLFGQFVVSMLDHFGIMPAHEGFRKFFALTSYGIPQPTDEIVKWYVTVLDGVPVRVYEPREKKGLLPGFVYYHGGGWVLSDLDMYHSLTHRLAKFTNTVLISVDYRLAPEHPFPAGLDDCFTATKSFIKNAAKFGVDPTRIAIGGDSAGGNLAAAVALRLRDEHVTPPVKVQVLIYPSVQLIDFKLPSYVNNQHDIFLNYELMKTVFSLYLHGSVAYGDKIMNNAHIPLTIRKDLENKFINLNILPAKYTNGFKKPGAQEPEQKLWNDIKGVVLNPYFTPILAPNATGLPAAYIYTGENDPLRDDGFLYANKLREGGNKVEHFHHDIGYHGMFFGCLDFPEMEPIFQAMTDFIVKICSVGYS